MKMVNMNFSGKRKLQRRAVTMFAVAPLYSLTMLSSFLRIFATTRPPTLLKANAATRRILTELDASSKPSMMSVSPLLATDIICTVDEKVKEIQATNFRLIKEGTYK